jgi:hypothetical protein
MIVRILGDGQFDVPDTERATLDGLDESLNAAVEGHDEAAFTSALGALIAAVRKVGEPLPADSFTSSDLVVPFSDASLAETKSLLEEPGGERA